MATGVNTLSVEKIGTGDPENGFGASRINSSLFGPEASINGATTIAELFYNAVAHYPNSPCLGHRPIDEEGNAGDYLWISYQETFNRAINFGSGLLDLGCCKPNSFDGLVSLGIVSRNRPEYVIADLGCYCRRIVPIPLYDTLAPEGILFCVRQTEMTTMLVASKLLDAILDYPSFDCLETIILIDGHELSRERFQELASKAQSKNFRLFGMHEIEELGRLNPSRPNFPAPHDTAYFCYTSGTTGNPKGAQISHRNTISCLASLRVYGLDSTENDVHLSYLPLAHVFERNSILGMLYNGGRVGFSQGDTLKILDDLVAIRPTVFPTVPRLLNRVRDKLLAAIAEQGGLKAWLFHKALNSKLEGLKTGSITHPLWDNLVFSPLKKRIGFDRLRLIICGSAPVAGHVLDFFRAVLGCDLYEGYGQTESTAIITCGIPGDLSTNNVGIPAPCNEVRLVSVPDMGYYCTDTDHSDGTACMGRGEICFRGLNSFQGYYRMQEKTTETIDEDGWIRTGDIGLWTPEGRLRIIDRKHNIFKLSQGEFVPVETVENIVQRSPFVAQCFVYGDSFRSCLVAIIVPDYDYLAAKNLSFGNPNLKRLTLDSLIRECRSANLKGYEIPKAIYLEETAFEFGKSASDGYPARVSLLTPTFKLQRGKAKEFYLNETGIIDKLYAEVESKSKL